MGHGPHQPSGDGWNQGDQHGQSDPIADDVIDSLAVFHPPTEVALQQSFVLFLERAEPVQAQPVGVLPVQRLVKVKRAAKLTRLLDSMAADDEHLYLNFGSVCYQLDARTGRQEKVFGSFRPSQRVAFDKAFRIPMKVDAKHSGELALEKTPTGLMLTLTTKDPQVVPADAWELFFDFRSAANRGNLYDPGIFQFGFRLNF